MKRVLRYLTYIRFRLILWKLFRRNKQCCNELFNMSTDDARRCLTVWKWDLSHAKVNLDDPMISIAVDTQWQVLARLEKMVDELELVRERNA